GLPASTRIRLLVQAFCKALRFRRDVTAFRLNAPPRPKTGSEPAFGRNEAEHVDTIEAAHNPEVAGSHPAPATVKGPGTGPFSVLCHRLSVPRSRHGCRALRGAGRRVSLSDRSSDRAARPIDRLAHAWADLSCRLGGHTIGRDGLGSRHSRPRREGGGARTAPRSPRSA